MLVLLIIFMVVTPMLQTRQNKWTWPKSTVRSICTTLKEDALQVAITADNKFSSGPILSIRTI